MSQNFDPSVWYNNLPWGQQILVCAAVMAVLYVAWSVISLLWRIPALVVAKTQLAEAQKEVAGQQVLLMKEQTRYYKLMSAEIESGG